MDNRVPKFTMKLSNARKPTKLKWWPELVRMVDGRYFPGCGTKELSTLRYTRMKSTVRPATKVLATGRHWWFQQEGASCHVTAQYLQLLAFKFWDRVIYRSTKHYRLPYLPFLSLQLWLLLLGTNHDSFMQLSTSYSAWSEDYRDWLCSQYRWYNHEKNGCTH